jgi:hypothetical protein
VTFLHRRFCPLTSKKHNPGPVRRDQQHARVLNPLEAAAAEGHGQVGDSAGLDAVMVEGKGLAWLAVLETPAAPQYQSLELPHQ